MPRNCFQKGVSGNPLGRPRGCKNKITGKSREMIQGFCEGYLAKIEEDFEQLEPKDRVKVFTDLLPFFLPKCSSIDVNAKVDADIQQKTDMYLAIAQQYGYSEQAPGFTDGYAMVEGEQPEDATPIGKDGKRDMSAFFGKGGGRYKDGGEFFGSMEAPTPEQRAEAERIEAERKKARMPKQRPSKMQFD